MASPQLSGNAFFGLLMLPFLEILYLVDERVWRRPTSARLGMLQVPFDPLLSGRLRWHGVGFVPVPVHVSPCVRRSNYARRHGSLLAAPGMLPFMPQASFVADAISERRVNMRGDILCRLLCRHGPLSFSLTTCVALSKGVGKSAFLPHFQKGGDGWFGFAKPS